MPAFSIASAEKAVMEIGTSCTDSARLRAVTVTSSSRSSADSSCAWAGSAASVTVEARASATALEMRWFVGTETYLVMKF